jgi:hypothetical protein
MHKMSQLSLVRQNLRLVKKVYPDLPKKELVALRHLTHALGLRLSSGEIRNIDGGWYVTHAGLLRLARRRRCSGIRTVAEKELCVPAANRWVFKATVYTRPGCKGFVGYGDADSSNVSPLVRGAEMRVAETRAVNRALRKAYGIGLCSVEELGWLSGPPKTSPSSSQSNGSHPSNGSGNSQPRLRDQLCLLIRQYNLDPSLVKAYAADFCGTQVLRDASRDLVESLLSTLAEQAAKDRDALICKLNSYSRAEAVKP